METVLDELKDYLNIESSDTSKDALLTTILMVSEGAIKNYCRGGLDGVVIDEDNVLKFAKLQYAAHLFLNRGLVSIGQTYELPLSFKYLLNPYVKY